MQFNVVSLLKEATGATRQLTAGAGEDIYPRCHP